MLDALTGLFGPIDSTELRRAARLARDLARWAASLRGGVAPEADGIEEEAEEAEREAFGGREPLVAAEAYLDDVSMPLALADAPLFAARRADTARVPQIAVVSYQQKQSEKANAKKSSSAKSKRSTSSVSEAQRAAEDLVAAEAAEELGVIKELAAGDQMDRDWLPVQVSQFSIFYESRF